MSEGRRLGILWVSQDIVGNMLLAVNDGRAVIKNDSIPKDAVLVEVGYDWARASFGFVFRHPMFDPVPDGGVIPALFSPTVHEVVADTPATAEAANGEV